jgi:hypothetical protein
MRSESLASLAKAKEMMDSVEVSEDASSMPQEVVDAFNCGCDLEDLHRVIEALQETKDRGEEKTSLLKRVRKTEKLNEELRSEVEKI